MNYITSVKMPLRVSMLRCRSRPASNPVLPLEVSCALVHFPIHIPGQQVMHSIDHGWLHNRSLLEHLPTKPSLRNMSHRSSDTCDNHIGAHFAHISHLALHPITARQTHLALAVTLEEDPPTPHQLTMQISSNPSEDQVRKS